MNAVVETKNGTQIAERDLMNVLKNSLYPGAADASVMMVMGYCRAAGLDVMKKPVHIVPIWNKDAGRMVDVIMPGIALYRTEAARTGEYVGKSEPEFGPDKTENLSGVEVTFPAWCRITVRRLVHGKICEFTAKEFWLENYATAKRDTQTPNAMWKKRAYGQLAKCAEAQALRMAFPEQTGGTTHRLATNHTRTHATQGDSHAIANKFAAFGAVAINADQSVMNECPRFLGAACETEAAEGC